MIINFLFTQHKPDRICVPQDRDALFFSFFWYHFDKIKIIGVTMSIHKTEKVIGLIETWNDGVKQEVGQSTVYDAGFFLA